MCIVFGQDAHMYVRNLAQHATDQCPVIHPFFFLYGKNILHIEITGKLSHSGYANFMERKVYHHNRIFPFFSYF